MRSLLTLTVLLTIAAPQDVPPAAELEPAEAFEGTWELVSVLKDDEARPTYEARLTVEDGRWREQSERSARGAFPWRVKRTAAHPWPRIERFQYVPRGGFSMITIGMRGIYKLDGDTLTFAFGLAEGRPPDGFDPAPDRTVEVWRRVRDDEPDTDPAP